MRHMVLEPHWLLSEVNTIEGSIWDSSWICLSHGCN